MSSSDDQNGDSGEVTLKDLFRVINTRFSELRADMNDRFDKVNAKLDAHTDELEGIRKAVDELPSLASVENLEDGQAGIKRDTEALRKDVRQLAADQRKIISRLDRAGIPAE